jgi:hypothetical protein
LRIIVPRSDNRSQSDTAAASARPTRWDFSLRTKLIVAFLLVALVPLGLLAYLDNRSTRQALTDAAKPSLRPLRKRPPAWIVLSA